MNLKYIASVILLVTVSFCNAQLLQDDNSALINAYFNQSNNFVKNKESNQKNSLLSQTSLYQIGDNNYMNINTSVKNKLEVSQQGNDNFYEFISYYGSKDSNIQVFQKGNNNGVYIYGENNLSKDLIINQQSNNQHIFITNYK
ncbi:hypothetical protein EGM88_06350 [Aureibaculum marinum]|uniref:Curlin n=1 Tax=Aureibaculum marinum TaxID=2487930 RepID=A0A3N4NSU8_9FLAO|nr:hypothetical protein [Aureibaculum marinum]RPD98805.1 hypothetical protein EGM88_06350 [Aureibaculum marinum]